MWVKKNITANMSEFFGPWTDKEDGDEEVVEETVETITTTTTRKQIPSVSPYEPLALIVTREPVIFLPQRHSNGRQLHLRTSEAKNSLKHDILIPKSPC